MNSKTKQRWKVLILHTNTMGCIEKDDVEFDFYITAWIWVKINQILVPVNYRIIDQWLEDQEHITTS